jgi:hypothetical protein
MNPVRRGFRRAEFFSTVIFGKQKGRRIAPAAL